MYIEKLHLRLEADSKVVRKRPGCGRQTSISQKNILKGGATRIFRPSNGVKNCFRYLHKKIMA